MANRFILSSKFTPYTFDELIKPLAMYGEAYKAREKEIDAINEKASSLAGKLDKDADSDAYIQYNNYMNELGKLSGDLASKGLSAETVSGIKGLSKRYASEIGSLENAQKALEAERDLRLKRGDGYAYKNPNLRIGDFMNGKNGAETGLNLDAVAKDFGTQFKAASQNISSTSWKKAIDEAGKRVPGYLMYSTTKGYDAAQAALITQLDNDTFNAAISGLSAEDQKLMTNLRNNFVDKLDSYGYDSTYTGGEGNKVYQAAVRGVYSGIGSTEDKPVADQNFESPALRYQKEKDKQAREEARIALEAKYPGIVFGEDGHPTGELKPGYAMNPNNGEVVRVGVDETGKTIEYNFGAKGKNVPVEKGIFEWTVGDNNRKNITNDTKELGKGYGVRLDLTIDKTVDSIKKSIYKALKDNLKTQNQRDLANNTDLNEDTHLGRKHDKNAVKNAGFDVKNEDNYVAQWYHTTDEKLKELATTILQEYESSGGLYAFYIKPDVGGRNNIKIIRADLTSTKEASSDIILGGRDQNALSD